MAEEENMDTSGVLGTRFLREQPLLLIGLSECRFDRLHAFGAKGDWKLWLSRFKNVCYSGEDCEG